MMLIKVFIIMHFPILKEFNFPFSIFLSTDFVDKKEQSDFMSWEMIKEIKRK